VKRIRRLLYPREPNGAWSPVLAAATLVATAAIAFAAWQSEPPQQGAAAPQPRTERAEISPYVRWLNQDVVYIIDDAERAAFQRLTTDEERDKFIEQFWLRRDPTPGAAENEFKKEHYRRIAYANERFRTPSGMPGWRTDRGYMYIVYGPPDEIESHPKGTQTSHGFEIWTYRHLEGIGNNVSITFIDRTGRGDYHLAPGNAR
jgi:GWxTD domain-containing protein